MDPKKRPLSIEQPADFYLRRAQRRREEGLWPEAVQDLRTALEKSPEDTEILWDLADLLSDLGRCDQSNELLLSRLHHPAVKHAETYAILGKNFLTLGELERARECLNLALSFEPDEDLEVYIMTLLDSVEDALSGIGETPLHLVGEDEAPKGIGEAVRLSGEGKLDQALKAVERSVRGDADSLSGCCFRAGLLYRMGREEEANEVVDKACAMDHRDPQDLLTLVNTLGYLRRHEDVIRYASQVLEEEQERSVFYPIVALAHYNLGHYAKAQEMWNRLLMIDPEEPGLRWYAGLASKAQAGETEYPVLPYTTALPQKEIFRRAELLSQSVAGKDKALEIMRTDPSFLETIRWMLDVDTDSDRTGLLHALFLLKGREMEGYFRRLLVRRTVKTEEKKEILGFLRQMDAPEPYVVLLEDGIVEAHVQIVPEGATGEAEVESLILKTQEQMDRGSLEEMLGFWRYCCRVRELRIRKPEAWAAALHYLYATLRHPEWNLTQDEVSSLYGVSRATVSRNAHMLYEIYLAHVKEKE